MRCNDGLGVCLQGSNMLKAEGNKLHTTGGLAQQSQAPPHESGTRQLDKAGLMVASKTALCMRLPQHWLGCT